MARLAHQVTGSGRHSFSAWPHQARLKRWITEHCFGLQDSDYRDNYVLILLFTAFLSKASATTSLPSMDNGHLQVRDLRSRVFRRRTHSPADGWINRLGRCSLRQNGSSSITQAFHFALKLVYLAPGLYSTAASASNTGPHPQLQALQQAWWLHRLPGVCRHLRSGKTSFGGTR